MIFPGQGQQNKNNPANADANANPSQPLTGMSPFEPQNVDLDADTVTRRGDAVTTRTPATNRIRAAGSGCDPLFRHAQGQEGAPATVSNAFDPLFVWPQV